MKPVAARWRSLKPRIVSAHSLALLLDYDGTLVPLTTHPSRAVLPQRIKRLLKQLARQPNTRVMVISGRALNDLKRVVGVDGICYVGNHGLELEEQPLRYLHPVARASRPLLTQIARNLDVVARQIPGAWIEDKRLTLSLHWRTVRESAQGKLQRLATQVLAPYRQRGAIRLTHGKRVIEVRPPVQWGKGDIIAWLHQRMNGGISRASPLFIYFGDDQTDEEAFRVVNWYQGISIVVGPRSRASAARWWVRQPSDVRAILTHILDARCQNP